MKKKVLKIILTVTVVFVAYNIIWFGWSRITYGRLSGGMEENPFSSFVVPRYIYTDEEGYDFAVKYPEYLSLTGNMSVGIPSTEGNVFTDALIIWPKVGGQYEFGVLLYDEDGTGYSVYINSEGNALSKEDADVVSRHSDNIRNLLIKADIKWGICD